MSDKQKQIPFDFDHWAVGDHAFIKEVDGTITEYVFSAVHDDEIQFDFLMVGLPARQWARGTRCGKQSFIQTMQLLGAYHTVTETAHYDPRKSIQQLLDEALAKVL